jgi:predicted nucleic-acid-binding protein
VIAIDTNILVRYLTNDDEALGARAEAILAANTCYVSRIMLLETVHVLESFYRLDRDAVLTALLTIFGLETILVEDHLRTAPAVDWFKAGMEFGDAMTLAAAHGRDELLTFDRDFARLAGKLAATPPLTHARR